MKIKKNSPHRALWAGAGSLCVFMLILKSTNQSRSQQASGLVLVVTLLAAGTTVATGTALTTVAALTALATGTALALNVTLGLLKKHAV